MVEITLFYLKIKHLPRWFYMIYICVHFNIKLVTHLCILET